MEEVETLDQRLVVVVVVEVEVDIMEELVVLETHLQRLHHKEIQVVVD